MKKTLVTLAALAMASVASAAETMTAGGWGNYEATDGYTYDASTYQSSTIQPENGNQVNNAPLVILNDGVGATYELTSGEVTFAAVEAKGTGTTFTKTGDGTIIIKNTQGSPTNVNVNGGTLATDVADKAFATGDVTVAAGATLQLNKADAHGYDSGATDKISLTGEAGKTASLVLGDRQTMTTNIELNGYSTISGSGSLEAYGGTIKATGSDNTISSTLYVRKEMKVQVDGSLEISGNVAIRSGSWPESDTLRKTGAGTLSLSETATVSSDVALAIDNGALDLTEVSTLDAKALNLASGTTLVLGDSPVTLSGTLTLAQGVTIDLSGWCDNASFTPYMSIFTMSGDGTFSDALDGLNVTLKVSDYVNTNAQLAVSADGKSLNLVPEPTTATLSLLALAGLAARRRRK